MVDKIMVKYEEEEYSISIPPVYTLKHLKKLIRNVIKVPLSCQNFVNLVIPVEVEDIRLKISDLIKEPNFILELKDMNILEERAPNLVKIIKNAQTPSYCFYVMSEPRVNKKLLVLGLDDTIYDRMAGVMASQLTNKFLAGRPYLQDFLRSVYPYYDVCVWSANTFNIIRKKLNLLNMIENKNYKILFCLDENATFVFEPTYGFVKRKSLQQIWCKYRQYNHRNTIICEYNDANVIDNPKNGVLLTKYSYTNHHSEKELLYLQDYLLSKRILQSEDLSNVDHINWRCQSKRFPDFINNNFNGCSNCNANTRSYFS